MKNVFFLLTGIILSTSMSAQIYIAKNCEISFFSSAPLENIEAHNKAAKPIINTETGDIQIKIAMNAFVFAKPLMQEHFNENYVESDKFPAATFKGKINEKVDWTKDGEYKVTATGTMYIHGVSKEITIDGLIKIAGSDISISSKFNIHVADYKIKIPSLVVQNIAEDVEVKLNATMEPFKKK